LRKKSAADSSAASGCIRLVRVNAPAVIAAVSFCIGVLPFRSKPLCYGGNVILQFAVAKEGGRKLRCNSVIVYAIDPAISKGRVRDLTRLLDARHDDRDLEHIDGLVETDRCEPRCAVKTCLYGPVLEAPVPQSFRGCREDFRMVYHNLSFRFVRELCRCVQC